MVWEILLENENWWPRSFEPADLQKYVLAKFQKELVTFSKVLNFAYKFTKLFFLSGIQEIPKMYLTVHGKTLNDDQGYVVGVFIRNIKEIS